MNLMESWYISFLHISQFIGSILLKLEELLFFYVYLKLLSFSLSVRDRFCCSLVLCTMLGNPAASVGPHLPKTAVYACLFQFGKYLFTVQNFCWRCYGHTHMHSHTHSVIETHWASQLSACSPLPVAVYLSSQGNFHTCTH